MNIELKTIAGCQITTVSLATEVVLGGLGRPDLREGVLPFNIPITKKKSTHFGRWRRRSECLDGSGPVHGRGYVGWPVVLENGDVRGEGTNGAPTTLNNNRTKHCHTPVCSSVLHTDVQWKRIGNVVNKYYYYC